MFLDRNIATLNMLNIAIRLNFNILNGLLGCLINYLINNLIDYLISYLSIIKELFDIVLRAVNDFWDIFLLPQLEQINTTIKHNRISLFDNVSKVRNVTIAIVSQNASSAVRFLVCEILDCEVNYAK